jgi:hypothetical protein
MGRSTQRAHELRVNRETDHLPLPFTQARHRSGGKNWVLWLSSTQGTYSLFSSCQENLFCLISLAHAVILCVTSLPHAAVARVSTVPPPRSCLRPRPPYHHLTHVAAPTVLKVSVPSRCFGRPSKLPHFLTERNGSQTQNRSALWSFSWRDMSHVQCPSKTHFEICKPVGDNLTASLANTNYICCVDERSQNVESKHILI